MTSTTLDRPTITSPDIKESDGDHERFAHYFKKSDIDKAFFDGQPIRALCGKKDVPMRDPSNYTLCPTCKEIHDSLPDNLDN